MAHLHLVKLCVGADGPEDLLAWQQTPQARTPDGLPRHVTRMWPRRAADLLAGGSIYWVFRGVILARQRLSRLDRVTGADGVERCALVLDPTLVLTAPTPRRPFQGWRYLPVADAPRDLNPAEARDPLPPALAAALAEIGVV